MPQDTAPDPNRTELSEEHLQLAFRLFLNRQASAAEVSRNMDAGLHVDRLREMFLTSTEFARKLKPYLPDVSADLLGWDQAAGRRRYLHLHIPKTAGTTLTALIGRIVPPEDCLPVSETARGPLDGMDPAVVQQKRFVFGHLTYRAVALMPADTTVLTVLRRPGDRLFSFYRYIKRIPDHPMHGPVVSKNLSFGGFLEFAEATPRFQGSLDNAQMRILAGTQAAPGKEAEIFAQAVAHIAGGRILFGLTERFDAFQTYLRQQGILRTLSATRLNVSDPEEIAPHLAHMTRRQKEIYGRFTFWDNLLYDICANIDAARQTEAAPEPIRKSLSHGAVATGDGDRQGEILKDV